MTPQDLQEWREHRGWSRARAIKEITGKDQVDIWVHWETGKTKIPLWLELDLINYDLLEIVEVFSHDR